jgi:hypothetical protein
MFTGLIATGGVAFGAGYILLIRRCFLDRTYAVPVVALCVYAVWDTRNALGYYHPWIPGLAAFSAVFCAGHAVALGQLLRYGRREFPGMPAWHFYGMIAVCLALAGAGVPALDAALHDSWGFVTGEGSLALSFGAYPMMVCNRRSTRGLSVPVCLLFLLAALLGGVAFLVYAPASSGVAGTRLAWLIMMSFALLGPAFLASLLHVRNAQRTARDRSRARPARDGAPPAPAPREQAGEPA